MRYIRSSRICGSVNAPPSKSLMQRAVLIAALAEGESRIANPSLCDDALATMAVVEALGAEVRRGEGGVRIIGGLRPKGAVLDCGESGTCMRMIAAVAALAEEKFTITGRGSLLARSVGMIERPLADLGAQCRTNGGLPPVVVKGPLHGGTVVVDGSVSSQFLSGLLMALPLCRENSDIQVVNLKSRPYVTLTESVMSRFGVRIDSHGQARGNLSSEHSARQRRVRHEVWRKRIHEGGTQQALPVGGSATTEIGDPAKLGERRRQPGDPTCRLGGLPSPAARSAEGGSTRRRELEGTRAPVINTDAQMERFVIHGGQRYRPQRYEVGGDWSGAAFLLVAGAIAGSVEVRRLASCGQADEAILTVLRRAGAECASGRDTVTVGKGNLRGFEFDATDCPDLVPPLVVLACNCEGRSVIFGAQRLVHKESDRAAVLASEFATLGARIQVVGDRLEIVGGRLTGGRIHSHHDHRIAMAGAVAALNSEQGVKIEQEGCVSKSYPAFFDDLTSLAVNR